MTLEDLASSYLGACARLALAVVGTAVTYTGAGREPDGIEWVSLKIDAGLGTRKLVHPIHAVESVRVYAYDSEGPPLVVPDREDFPDVPHLNPAYPGQPRSLCLYEEPWEEVRLTWSPIDFLERVRAWFTKTAYGELHDERQALEPPVLGQHWELIVPAAWFERAPRDEVLLATYPGAGNHERVLRVIETEEAGRGGKGANSTHTFVAVIADAGSRAHGRLSAAPRNLAEVLGLDIDIDTCIRAALWSRVRNAADHKGQPLLDRPVLLLLSVDLQRSVGAEVERRTLYGFATSCSLGKIGAALGWLERTKGIKRRWSRLLLNVPPDRAALEHIDVEVCRVHSSLSRARAADAAGRVAYERPLALVGAGALGSQLARTLTQEGFGRWTIIDHDVLLPHNLARHALGWHYHGRPKAEVLAFDLSRLLDDDDAAKGISLPVHPRGEIAAPVAAALDAAEVVIDTSASVATGRRLRRDGPMGRPLVSAFMNPAGTDLVVLGERAIGAPDAGAAEALYYRTICLEEVLDAHLADPDTGVLSGLSCREPSAQMPQSRVMRLAGRAADVVRRAVDAKDSFVELWRDDDEGQRRLVHRIGSIGYTASVDGWRIVAPGDLIDELVARRSRANGEGRTPTETGGVVCGVWDRVAREVLLVHTLGPPTDSERAPDGFRRGWIGLAATVEAIRERTRRLVSYVGEWHTHPPAHSSSLSVADQQFLVTTAHTMALDGLPALMLVVGDDGVRVAVKDAEGNAAASALLEPVDVASSLLGQP